jgi:hypothetical protein
MAPAPAQGSGVSASAFIATAAAAAAAAAVGGGGGGGSGGGGGGGGGGESERRGKKKKTRDGEDGGGEGGSAVAGGGGGDDGGDDNESGERPLEIFNRAQKVQRRMRMSRFPVPGELRGLVVGGLGRGFVFYCSTGRGSEADVTERQTGQGRCQ